MFKIIDENGEEILDTDVVNLNSNDIIILKADKKISPEMMKELSNRLEKVFKENKYLILSKECDIGILKGEINLLQENSERKVLKG